MHKNVEIIPLWGGGVLGFNFPKVLNPDLFGSDSILGIFLYQLPFLFSKEVSEGGQDCFLQISLTSCW
jgi:hypothetical protein